MRVQYALALRPGWLTAPVHGLEAHHTGPEDGLVPWHTHIYLTAGSCSRIDWRCIDLSLRGAALVGCGDTGWVGAAGVGAAGR